MKQIGHLERYSETLIIAHRGASKAEYENTIKAFETAINLGADAIELDVRRTADGVIVVHHNATVPLSRRRLSKLRYREVERLANKRGYSIPTLKETLHQCAGRIALDIELKETGYEAEVVSLACRKYNPRHLLFTSFHDDALIAIKRAHREARTGLLLGIRAANSLSQWSRLSAKARLMACGADVVIPHWQMIRFGFVNRMHALGLPVAAWTVDSPRRALRLVNQGVSAIITNVPDTINSHIKQDAKLNAG